MVLPAVMNNIDQSTNSILKNEQTQIMKMMLDLEYYKMRTPSLKVRYKKSTECAVKYLDTAKVNFQTDEWQLTVLLFSNAIRVAPPGSNELTCAYAGRSAACLYEDCLLDIDNALSIGYPDNLNAKL